MQASHSAIEMRLQIQKLNTLPPMSMVAQELLAALGDNNLDVRHIAAIIERDPALLARIIGLANSAYYGYTERVTTAEDAIFHVLGLNTARNLALSVVLSGPFQTAHCREFRLDEYWTNAMVTAALAQRLAPYVSTEPAPNAGNAYLAGLLHSLGELALVHLYPTEMATIFRQADEDDGMTLTQRETALLGADHLQVGGWLARKWHLPQFVVTVIEKHEDTDYRGEHRALAHLVGFCVHWLDRQNRNEDEVDLGSLAVLGIASCDAEKALDEMLGQKAAVAELAKVMSAD